MSVKTYEVLLKSEPSRTFRCQKAADSQDINVEKKLTHHLKIDADIESPFQIGLIVGNSGSGKTTLARQIYGDDCFTVPLDPSLPVIEQFPKSMPYDSCVRALTSIGLTSVPCWIRPVATLSNGQKARAEAALAMNQEGVETILIDEWTSVVDRTVAKVMSHSLRKFADREENQGKRIVLLSCHYDIIEWLQPDWIIDCNERTFQNRRLLRPERQEKLEFELREVNKSTWGSFSKYHYLSDRLPGGKLEIFGFFHRGIQIGFICYAVYVPQRQNTMYANRLVLHPDYCGLGMGGKLSNLAAHEMTKRGYRVRASFASILLHKIRSKDPLWCLAESKLKLKQEPLYESSTFGRTNGTKAVNAFRSRTRTYTYDFIPSLKNRP